MATINFLLRSTVKKNDPFTARLQFYNPSKITDINKFGLDFIEAKTEIFVFTPEEVSQNNLIDGKKYWNEFKKYKGSNIEVKTRIERIISDQTDLRNFILNKYDDAFPEGSSSLPTKVFLESVVKEYYSDKIRDEERKKNAQKPKDLIWHFDNYIRLKNDDLKGRTLMKLENTKKILIEFEKYQSSKKGYNYKILIPDVDEDLKYDLNNYLKNIKLYSRNTIAKTIKVIRTICNFSTRYGIQLSLTYDDFTMAYDETDVIFLSFKELQSIKNTKVSEELVNAKNWLYLSSFLGQRVSDFMRFNSKMIRKEGKSIYIDFTQEKTNKKMALLAHPEVVKMLQENNMKFPDPIDELTYNEQIKEVCRIAGITEKVRGSILKEVKKGVWRKVVGTYSKYLLIGSHIGRKSYCSNFYGKIPTALILEVSGHTEERTLMSYIGKKDSTNSELIYNYYQNIDITED
ncbi:phage integrase SAM-like domain-containing protein [Epilithonimonas hominis]|uniref:phage integrase SAM-like domain-containing protein n=1 Tax=Epilithonimonas hominis TaxID=420404 RepID=UPI00289CF5AD|nr:phage integrase SAM-like domain-containing protein [Epilithonimonas hominis]